MEALKDITKEIHEIQLKNIKHKKNGYLTSTVGRYFLFFNQEQKYDKYI